MSFDANAIVHATTQTAVNPKQVEAVLTLLITEECTIPFVARYRKERTGGLDEVQIAAIKTSYEGYLEREARREYILKTIAEMDKLTPELEKKIKAADSINVLEDLYAPYKSKKKTKGQLAVEAGLSPLADALLEGNKDEKTLRALLEGQLLNKEHKIESWEDAMKGAQDIIIETIAHDVELKETLRGDYWRDAKIVSSKKDKAEEVKDYHKFKDYFEFEQKISELKDPKNAHRFLAMRRGLTMKILKVDVVYDEEAAGGLIKRKYLVDGAKCADILENCIKRAYNNYIHSSLDLEVKTELKKDADEAAISIFGVNLKNLLLQPYLGARAVLGLDPGVRTGVKVALVDQTGKYMLDTVVYPFPPQNDVKGAKGTLNLLLEKVPLENIAVGNGTYGRETLEFLEEHVDKVKDGTVKATLVNEAGASIYSASEIARKEFPDKDPTVRGAISIARRFQDPLAELVKIDPKSIGVGQYQHDVNQARLKKSLESVVESCVNFVGVDLNTASAPLLSYVSGIGPSVAGNIVKYREEKGPFKDRTELLKVSRFSDKVFTQAAGFLRIYNGKNPLDGTFIHPETYPTLTKWARDNGIELADLATDREVQARFKSDSSLKSELGAFTFEDIVKSLMAPSQDPRTEFKSTEFRKDVKDLKDLKIGEWYTGVVTNITAFGAFVDIGLKENGLVHISEMADHFVSDPLQVFKVGQEVKARVIEVDFERKRIALSCKSEDKSAPRPNMSASTRSERGQRPATPKNMGSDAPLKNNAFAALKNLKLK